MTEDKLLELGALWRDGWTLKRIARKLGYTPNYVSRVAMEHRDLCPVRRRWHAPEEHALWADRVLSGELTQRKAARMAGVTPTAIYYWCRERRAGA
jgi:transcriptional regulator with XRE-family HTH domain